MENKTREELEELKSELIDQNERMKAGRSKEKKSIIISIIIGLILLFIAISLFANNFVGFGIAVLILSLLCTIVPIPFGSIVSSLSKQIKNNERQLNDINRILSSRTNASENKIIDERTSEFQKALTGLDAFFREKYKMGLLDFKRNLKVLLTFAKSEIPSTEHPYALGTTYRIAFNDKFLVCTTFNYEIEDKVWSLLTKAPRKTDTEYVKIMQYCLQNKDEISESIIPMSSILYFEKIDNVITVEGLKSYTGKPSKTSLMMTEAMFGTAAAINKSNNSGWQTLTPDKVEDHSAYRIVFDETISKVIYIEINEIRDDYLRQLIERMSKDKYDRKELARLISQNQQQYQTVSSADEIRKLKQLLDENIITKEEFEKKKKEILGL